MVTIALDDDDRAYHDRHDPPRTKDDLLAGNAAERGRSVTSRVVALLKAFDDTHRSLTLTELADRAGLTVPTAHRLGMELVSDGVLARLQSGRFVIGETLWELGLLAPTPTHLAELASPFLHDLYAATRATVHLAERDGHEVRYLDRLSGHASVPIVSTVGSKLPMHATGVGKVLLAHAPDDVREAVLGKLQRVTVHTITQPQRLEEQLRNVRRDGYATTSEEMSLGACSVAVPVRDRDGTVLAALGIVVPDLRQRSQLVAAMQVAARGVERHLAV